MTTKQLITLASAISLAIGGGTGTLAGDYRSGKKVEELDERLRQVEIDTTATQRDVQYIKEKVDETTKASKGNSEKLQSIDSNLQILLDRSERASTER